MAELKYSTLDSLFDVTCNSIDHNYIAEIEYMGPVQLEEGD